MEGNGKWRFECISITDPGQLKYPKKFVFSFEKCDQAVVDEQNFCNPTIQSSIFLPEVNDHDVN